MLTKSLNKQITEVSLMSKNLKQKLKIQIKKIFPRNNETAQSCNPCHNILELYNVLGPVWFAKSKTKLDIY